MAAGLRRRRRWGSGARRFVGVGLGALGFGSIALGPSTSAACVTISEQKLVGAPRDGDVDVPTDVELIYDANLSQFHDDAVLPPKISLTADDGESVEFATAKTYAGYMEYIPAAPLRPNTGYTFRGLSPGTSTRPAYDLKLRFKTGSGPMVGLPAPAAARYEDYVHDTTVHTSCSQPLTGGCVSLEEGALFSVTTIDSIGQRRVPANLYASSFFNDLHRENFPCAEISRRGLNGTLSEPQLLCGPGAPVKTLKGDSGVLCTPEGVVLVPPPGTGGMVGTGGMGPTGTGGSAGDSSTEPMQDRLVKGCTCSTPQGGGQSATFGVGVAFAIGLWARRRRVRALSRRVASQ